MNLDLIRSGMFKVSRSPDAAVRIEEACELLESTDTDAKGQVAVIKSILRDTREVHKGR